MTELAEIAVSYDASATIVAIAGEVDSSNADDVARTLAGLAHTRGRGLIIDLSRLEFIASAGVRAILSVTQRPDREPDLVRLVVPSDSPIRRILLILDIPKLIPIHQSVPAALAAARVPASGAAVLVAPEVAPAQITPEKG